MPEDRDQRVLFVGDSFVAGVGDESGLGWVGRVVAASHAAGHPITAYNLGVRGETSHDVAQRWRAEARPRALPGTDCRVVFSFGSNDVAGGERMVPVVAPRARQMFGRMLDEARALGLRAFAVGPPPLGDAEIDPQIAALSSAFGGLARGRHVPFVEVAGELRGSQAWRSVAQARDGTHPGADGYRALADLVLAGGWLSWLEGPGGWPRERVL